MAAAQPPLPLYCPAAPWRPAHSAGSSCHTRALAKPLSPRPTVSQAQGPGQAAASTWTAALAQHKLIGAMQGLAHGPATTGGRPRRRRTGAGGGWWSRCTCA